MSSIEEHCKLEHEKRMNMEDVLESFIVLTASKLDYMTEAIMEQNMCTATCPCDASMKSQFENSLTQTRLTEHGRSKSSTSPAADLKPFVWSNNAGNSYKDFESCYKNKLMKDSKISLGRQVKEYIRQKEAKGTTLDNFVA